MKNKPYFCSINKRNKYFWAVPFLSVFKPIFSAAIMHTFVFYLVPNATFCSQGNEGEADIVSEGGEKRKRNLSEESMPSKKKQKSLFECWSTPSTKPSEKIMDEEIEPVVAPESIPMKVGQVNMGVTSSEGSLSVPTISLSQEIKSISFPDYNREGLYDLKVSLLTVGSWKDALNERTKRHLESRASLEDSTIASEETETSSADDEKKGGKKEIRKFDVIFKEGNTSYKGLVLLETVRLQPKGWVAPLKKFLTAQEALKEEERTEETLPKVDHSALLFIEMSGRNFVGMIGQGRHLLKPNVRDPQFAFHAALNGCDLKAKDAIKNIGITIPGSNPRHSYTFYDRGTSVQDVRVMPRVGSLKKIDVNKRKPDNSRLRVKASGPSLSLQQSISIDDFPKLCQEFWKLSQSDRYKDILPWIDSLVPVDNSALLKRLGQKLLNRIADPDNFEWGLASPDDDEHGSETPVARYKLSKESYRSIEDIVSFIRGKERSNRELKRLKVKSLDSEGNELNTWSVYRGILMEINYKADVYTFNQGKWYKIKHSDYEQIKKDVDQFFVNESGNSTLNFLTPLKPNSKELSKAKPKDGASAPSPKKPTRKRVKKESSRPKYSINEGAYSRRICEENPGECLRMDARNVGINIGPEREKDVVELCDILTTSKYLITLKNWTGSDTFSHLLNQGVVPSQTLEDPKFRMSAKDQYVKAQLKEWLEKKIHNMKAEKIMDDLTGICNECAFTLPDRDQVIRDKSMEYVKANFNAHISEADRTKIEKMIELDQKKIETILPTNMDSFNGKDYTFVYGFFHEKEYKSLSQYLPYFSLMALHNALVTLNPNYKVLIKRIAIPPLH